MFFPVTVDFGDDPLLRLQGFGREAGPVPTTADCGAAVSNVVNFDAGGDLYQVARDAACRDESREVVVKAAAAGLVVFMVGAGGAVATERRSQGGSAPRRAVRPRARAAPRKSSGEESTDVEKSGDAPPAEE